MMKTVGLRAANSVLFALAFALVITAGSAHAASEVVQNIANHFSNVRTMTGDFVQFGPRGEQTGGTFYLQRPGKIRFDYDRSTGLRVMSDGTSVVVENRKLNTADVYPLSQTPLKLLLDERIDLSGNRVQSVREEEDLITIALADRQAFGGSTITMMFDADSYDLRQWTITDAQGRDTTVMVDGVRQGITFDPSVFQIDYRRVNSLNRDGR